jgi:hypothetical protein
MKEPVKRDPFTDKSKELFDGSVGALDAATLSRLNQGRQRALAELDRPAPAGQWLRWAPVTAVAAAALIAVMLVNRPAEIEVPITATDFEMLIESEELDLLEDLEFYSWLELADAETTGDVG